MTDDAIVAPEEQAIEQTTASSMADFAEPMEQAESAESNEQQTNEPSQELDSWQWGEGVKGNGEKPQWLKERYKSVEEQAKAYTELEKKFGEFKGAPKEGYVLESIEGIDKDSDLLKSLLPTLQEMNLSQSGFERLATEYITLQHSNNAEYLKQEIEKLGTNAKQQISEVSNWASSTFNDDISQTIKTWMQSADDVKALRALMSAQQKSNIPTADGNPANAATYETLAEINAEKVANYDRYMNDENYRNSVSRRFHMAHSRENNMRK